MDAAAADPEQEQTYAYLPPQATRGATRMVPTAGRTWQQRRLIRGAGAQTRAVGAAWSRLSGREREAFGSHRGFRAHLEATAMNRAVQSAEAKEEAARQAGRAAANAETQRQAQTQGQTQGTTNTAAAAATTTTASSTTPPPRTTRREESPEAKDIRAGQLRREWDAMPAAQKQRWAQESGADQGVPTRNLDPWQGTQWARVRGSTPSAPATNTPPAAPAKPSASSAPPAAAAADTPEQALAEARRKRLQSRTGGAGGTPTSYLGTLRRRIG